ncbi:hypothetical protein M8J75_011675 [Diaphorina citri]|nr:hypothetical protein M8J75_011675 [Diaphorina citri]
MSEPNLNRGLNLFEQLVTDLPVELNQLVETFTHDSRDLGRAISSEHDSAGAGIQDNKGGHLSDPLVRILADV